jgi:uncharacterized protein YegL
MEGSKIASINDGFISSIPKIQQISKNEGATIQISVLKFSVAAEFTHPVPIDVDKFNWTYLIADGWTNFGVMCRSLNEKLSLSGFMDKTMKACPPLIFLLSDGQPCDDYLESLNELKQNGWFKNSIKLAVNVSDENDTSILAEFTGSSARVFTVFSPEALKKIIRFITVTSASIGVSDYNFVNSAISKEDEVTFKTHSYVALALHDSNVDEF